MENSGLGQLPEKPIILFDGVCNLCSGSVQFFLKHESNDVLTFASLQSETGEKLLRHFDIDPKKFDSIIFIENGKAYQKSKAITRVSRNLKYPWKILSWFYFFPKWIGYPVYDLVAKNRYRFFGKKDACWMPDPKWKSRFLG